MAKFRTKKRNLELVSAPKELPKSYKVAVKVVEIFDINATSMV